ncbi:MAG: hypothetical protein HGB21_17340, partial [Nitrospirae bacterium]|nr:hypothetical protein [Nitrospirota bacterium]
MINTGNAVKRGLALIIIFSVVFFFYNSFQGNWSNISSQVLKLDYLYLALSFIPLVVASLLATYGWHLALNTLSHAHKMTFTLSIATVNTSIALFNRSFRRGVTYFDIPHRLLIDLHLIHVLAAFCLCLGAYLLCYGIGFALAPHQMLLVMSSLLISDVIGFLAIIVPGGLG